MVLAACGPSSTPRDGGATDAGPPDSGALPCDVARLLQRYCSECHRDPPVNSAPFPITGRDELLAPPPISTVPTVAERALIRMRSQSAPMPPVPTDGGSRPRPSKPEVDAFSRWIDAGFPFTGACSEFDAGVSDAGADGGADAGYPTTCASGMIYDQITEPPGELMNPGLSCPSCHFENQLFYVYFQYAGTVMAAVHERDRCKSPPPPGGTVEILELDGGVWWSTPVNSSGSFHNLDAGPSPFVARLITDAGVKVSASLHLSGNCNSCHTAQGANDAGGRLTWP